MARRGWMWVVGVGLCGGLLSACAHTVSDHFVAEAAPPSPAVSATRVAATPPPQPAATVVQAAAKQEKAAEDRAIRPAHYPPEGHPEIDLLPPDRPGAPPPAAPPPPEP